MANINDNIINELISPADLTVISNSLLRIMNALPMQGTLTLTPEQLSGMQSMDVDNRVQVQKVIEEMKGTAASILPSYFSVVKLQNDNELNEQLETIEAELQNVMQAVMYLKRLSAHESVGTSNAVYQMIKSAAAAGVPGAQTVYERLRVRFEGLGGPKLAN